MPNVLPRVAAGDSEAMSECLQRYGGLVWTLASRMVPSRDVEDAVQDVFVELWRSANRFDDGKGEESTFIATIARRRLIDRRRADGRRIDTSVLDDPVARSTKQDGLEIRDEAARVRKMMGKLREEERHVLELAIDQGMSQSEIASATGMALGTVKTNARRGMLRLRELLRIETKADGATDSTTHQKTEGGMR